MKYFCYFDYKDELHHERSNPPAAATKLLYIARCLAEIEPTDIVSASGVIGKKADSARRTKIQENLHVRYFFALGRKNWLLSKIATILLLFQLLLFLMTKVKRDETILVYHSLGYMRIIELAKRIKGFKLILEVEEIYSDVIGSQKGRDSELSFFQSADGFVFPTKQLSGIINIDNKPEVIIHGTYQEEPERKHKENVEETKVANSEAIHCLYAGTLDARKGGAIAAASAAEYLPNNYHVHILGFGSEQEVAYIKQRVNEITARSKAILSYDGLLSGEAYIEFMQRCDIGLSTQNPDGAFNNTSFPSKILSYMANGLSVVSARIPVVMNSDIGDYIYYYEQQGAKEIASAIMNVECLGKEKNRQVVQNLDRKFKLDLRSLLGKIEHNEEN